MRQCCIAGAQLKPGERPVISPASCSHIKYWRPTRFILYPHRQKVCPHGERPGKRLQSRKHRAQNEFLLLGDRGDIIAYRRSKELSAEVDYDTANNASSFGPRVMCFARAASFSGRPWRGQNEGRRSRRRDAPRVMDLLNMASERRKKIPLLFFFPERQINFSGPFSK